MPVRTSSGRRAARTSTRGAPRRSSCDRPIPISDASTSTTRSRLTASTPAHQTASVWNHPGNIGGSGQGRPSSSRRAKAAGHADAHRRDSGLASGSTCSARARPTLAASRRTAATEFVRAQCNGHRLAFHDFKSRSSRRTCEHDRLQPNPQFKDRSPAAPASPRPGTKWSGSLKVAVGSRHFARRRIGDTIPLSFDPVPPEGGGKVAVGDPQGAALSAGREARSGPHRRGPTCGPAVRTWTRSSTEIERPPRGLTRPDRGRRACADQRIGEGVARRLRITGARTMV